MDEQIDKFVDLIFDFNMKDLEDETKLLENYKKLQQENKQLKESLKDEEQQRIKIAKERDELHKECLNHIEQKKQLKEVIEEIRKTLKLERKTALSLNQAYTVSVIDSVLQILDKGVDK